MNIVITGSLGHISKPLAIALVKKGHAVTVVSSKPDKQKEIETLGAEAAIGSVYDVDFLTKVFTGAEVAYCMIPPVSYFNLAIDLMEDCRTLARNFKQAILKTGIKKVVHLSSIGAHTDKGNGMLLFHYLVENILRELPAEVAIKHLRPVGFYYNLLNSINTIKTQGSIISNYGNLTEPWVSPADIADAAVEEITTPFDGRTVRYIASDELNSNEIAAALGAAIGKPDLKWLVIPDEQLLQGLVSIGMNPVIAKGFVEMNAGRRDTLYEDYYRHRPVLGKVKLKDFAKDFAEAFNKGTQAH